jgi:putative FmdB family regulatory protein
MPLYEYQCEACGHRFEVIQKFSDAPLEACPRCNGVVRKLLSSPAIQFKGSGWYITDYARAGKTDGAAAGGDKAADSKRAASGTSSTESKAEPKTETKVESKPETKPATS